MERPRPELARDLRLSHAMAVVVGTIIGSGIFLVPAEMMQALEEYCSAFLYTHIDTEGLLQGIPLDVLSGRP